MHHHRQHCQGGLQESARRLCARREGSDGAGADGSGCAVVMPARAPRCMHSWDGVHGRLAPSVVHPHRCGQPDVIRGLSREEIRGWVTDEGKKMSQNLDGRRQACRGDEKLVEIPLLADLDKRG
jgi:hypothetical protein